MYGKGKKERGKSYVNRKESSIYYLRDAPERERGREGEREREREREREKFCALRREFESCTKMPKLSNFSPPIHCLI